MVFTVKEMTVLKFKLIGTSFKSQSDMFFFFFVTAATVLDVLKTMALLFWNMYAVMWRIFNAA